MRCMGQPARSASRRLYVAVSWPCNLLYKYHRRLATAARRLFPFIFAISVSWVYAVFDSRSSKLLYKHQQSADCSVTEKMDKKQPNEMLCTAWVPGRSTESLQAAECRKTYTIGNSIRASGVGRSTGHRLDAACGNYLHMHPSPLCDVINQS